MSSIGKRIKSRRESLNMSQDELAKQLGYKSRSSINKIEIDERCIPQSKIELLAISLKTDIDFIMGWKQEKKEISLNFENIIQIPIYEGLSCGTGGFVDEFSDEYIPIPNSMLRAHKEYFANYANGDSMIDQHIFHNDLLIFEKTNQLQNGDIGSFNLDYEDATCKIFKQDPKSKMIMLLPANNMYDPIPITEEYPQFRVLGKLALVINNRQRS